MLSRTSTISQAASSFHPVGWRAGVDRWFWPSGPAPRPGPRIACGPAAARSQGDRLCGDQDTSVHFRAGIVEPRSLTDPGSSTGIFEILDETVVRIEGLRNSFFFVLGISVAARFDPVRRGRSVLETGSGMWWGELPLERCGAGSSGSCRATWAVVGFQTLWPSTTLPRSPPLRTAGAHLQCAAGIGR